jgi:hypothetical protein
MGHPGIIARMGKQQVLPVGQDDKVEGGSSPPGHY